MVAWFCRFITNDVQTAGFVFEEWVSKIKIVRVKDSAMKSAKLSKGAQEVY